MSFNMNLFEVLYPNLGLRMKMLKYVSIYLKLSMSDQDKYP